MFVWNIDFYASSSVFELRTRMILTAKDAQFNYMRVIFRVLFYCQNSFWTVKDKLLPAFLKFFEKTNNYLGIQ